MYRYRRKIGGRRRFAFVLSCECQLIGEMMNGSVSPDFRKIACEEAFFKLCVTSQESRRPGHFQFLNSRGITPLMSENGANAISSCMAREDDKACGKKEQCAARHWLTPGVFDYRSISLWEP